MAKPRTQTPETVRTRVERALAMGALKQWLLLETATEVAEAKALLAAAKARHVEPLTADELARRQAAALAAITARALASHRPRPAVLVEAEAPEPARRRRKAA